MWEIIHGVYLVTLILISSKGWLLLLVPLVLWLNSRSSVAVDRKSAFTTQSPHVDEQGLYTYRVGNTTVYNSSPIPFW